MRAIRLSLVLALLVPFGTIYAAKPGGPTKLGPAISWYDGNAWLSGQVKVYAADLNGDGVDEVILAGLIKNGKKSRVAVVDNTGKNVTKKYIRPTTLSTEAPQIYDLNNDGKDDVIFWGGTDSDHHVPSYVYLSKKKGAHTRKMITPKVWYHGSGQGDLDGDGKEDFVGTGYAGKGKYVVSYKKKLLIRKLKYSGSQCCFDGIGPYSQRGSDIVAGNFDADSNIELIISDYLKDQDAMAVEVYKTDSRFIYVRDDSSIRLPTEYWETPRGKSRIRKHYKNVNAVWDLSHDVRLLKFDVNRDGKLDLLRVSRPWQGDKKASPACDAEIWPHFGHIQVLINNGKGVFSDKTAKHLKRWNLKLNAPYNFKLADINKDGLTDIFYTELDVWSSADCSKNATAANGFLINTGKGFKNFGNSWFKRQTKRAIATSKKVFDYQDGSLSVSFALGNFDNDSDLEVASCVRGGMYKASGIKSYCRFWFSDISIKFPKYKARKSSASPGSFDAERIYVIEDDSGNRIYTDQPWLYSD